MKGRHAFSEREIIEFEACVTSEFSDKYGLPLSYVCDLFLKYGVYQYLEKEIDLLMMKNTKFISENIMDVFEFQSVIGTPTSG